MLLFLVYFLWVFKIYLDDFEFVNVGLKIFPVIVREIFASFTGQKVNRQLQIHWNLEEGGGTS